MKKDLTPRQWKVYQFYKEHELSNLTNKEKLELYEEWLRNEYYFSNTDLSVEEYRSKYGFGYVNEIIIRDIEGRSLDFVNLTSGRNFRKDLRALRNHPTIQKVITQKGIADTVEDATEYLKRKEIKILTLLKEFHIEKKKLEKHLQTRFQFNHERDFIEAVRGNVNE